MIFTIFGNEGEALCAGEIHFVRRRFWDNHKLDAGVWNYQKQKGVSYNQWMQWFWTCPPLKGKTYSEMTVTPGGSPTSNQLIKS